MGTHVSTGLHPCQPIAMSELEGPELATVSCSTDIGLASTTIEGLDTRDYLPSSHNMTIAITRSELTDPVAEFLPSYPRPGLMDTTIMWGDSAYTVRAKYNMQLERSRSAATCGRTLPTIPACEIPEAALSTLLARTKSRGGRPVVDTTIYPSDTAAERRYKRKIEQSRAQSVRKREAKKAAQKGKGKRGCEGHSQTFAYANIHPAQQHTDSTPGREWHDVEGQLDRRVLAFTQQEQVDVTCGRSGWSPTSTSGYQYLPITPGPMPPAISDIGRHAGEPSAHEEADSCGIAEYINSEPTDCTSNVVTLPGRGSVLTILSSDPDLPPVGLFSVTPDATRADRNDIADAPFDELLAERGSMTDRSRQNLLRSWDQRFLRRVAEYMDRQRDDDSDQETIVDGDARSRKRRRTFIHHRRQTKPASVSLSRQRRGDSSLKARLRDTTIMPGDSALIVQSKYKLQCERSRRARSKGDCVPKYPYSRIPQAEVYELLQTKVSIPISNADVGDWEKFWLRGRRSANMNKARSRDSGDAQTARPLEAETSNGDTQAGSRDTHGSLSHLSLSEAEHSTIGQQLSAAWLARDGGQPDDGFQAVFPDINVEMGPQGYDDDNQAFTHFGELGLADHDLQDQAIQEDTSFMDLTDGTMPDWPGRDDLDLEQGTSVPIPDGSTYTEDFPYLSLDALVSLDRWTSSMMK